MKRLFLFRVLPILLLLSCGAVLPAMAGPGQPPVLQVLDGSLGQLSKDSFNVVSDTLFFNHTGNDELASSYPVRNNITLRINPYSLYALKGAFAATVRLELTLTAANGGITTIDTSLTVRYNKDSSYTDQDSYIFSNAYRVKVKILDRSTDAVWNVWNTLKLENELQSFPVYTFDCTKDTVQSVTHTTLDSNTVTDELPVSWSAATGADQYDLEWTYIDSSALAGPTHLYGDPVHPNAALIFDNNSSRVTITGTTYNIPIFYDGAGTLFFRVRPVQLQAGGGRTEGHWTSDQQVPGSFYFKGHQRNLNWQSTASYAEEGKRKVVVQYYDGSLRGRQTVTKDNTTNTTIVSESYYDYQGRPVIQVLPAPTFSNVINYSQNFNLGLNGAYDKNDFDSLYDPSLYCNTGASAMGTGSGASQYYSPANPDKDTGIHKYIPDAQGYPFTQVEYLQDNTGRISRQSGVGPTHKLGSGHETQYYYGTPDQHDLDALFGTEVGDHSHYFKTMVRDANGQFSVSYTDMHGRTIATALAGVPDNVKLDTLSSYQAQNITETLADPTSNVIKDLVMESKKGLLVAVPGIHTFTYTLNPASLQLPDCNNTPVCYDCLYDLEITMTDDCNNQKLPGGHAFDTVFHNFTLGGRPDTTCGKAADSFAIHFCKDLPVGSYEITKRLSVSRYGESYYRDSVFMKRNACRTSNNFLQEQRAIEASITQCQPTCQSCKDNLGTWSQYYTNFITHAGIAAGDSSYKDMILTAYQQAQSACRLLCDSVNEADDIRAAMLLDMTPPSGQYANADSVWDKYSIFRIDTNSVVTDTAKYALSANRYVDENGKLDSVYDESTGKTVRPQDLSPETFAAKFKLSWAPALLPYHPEYCKLSQYDNIPLSTAWDRRFEAADTYVEAVRRGYLNPTQGTETVFLRYNATITDSADYDPLAAAPYSNGTTNYKTTLENNMKQYLVDQSSNHFIVTLWQMATATVRCANRDQSCIVKYNNNDSAFASYMCGGDQDMIWRSFRQMYLDIKRKTINARLTASCPAPDPTASTLLTAGHQPHFSDGAELVQATKLVPSMDSTTIRQQNQVSIANYYDSTCRAYVSMWWQDLQRSCNSYSSTDSAAIIPLLIQVCKEGSDADHPFGASSVAPASSNQYKSFEDVIDQYNVRIGNHIAGCNAYGITAPAPYGQQVIYNNKPLWTRPSDCECSQIASMYANYQSVAGHYTSFSDYLHKSFQTDISDADLTTLRSLCNSNPATASCNYLAAPIQLPPDLQCGSGDICVGSTQFKSLDSAFRAKYPEITPVTDPSPTDSAQLAANGLYESYMNYQLGFAKTAGEYLAFLNQTHGVSSNVTDSLQQILTDFNKSYYPDTTSIDTIHFVGDIGGAAFGQSTSYNYQHIFSNGVAHIPESLVPDNPEDTTGYVHYRKKDTLCISNEFTIETRVKKINKDIANTVTQFQFQFNQSESGTYGLFGAIFGLLRNNPKSADTALILNGPCCSNVMGLAHNGTSGYYPFNTPVLADLSDWAVIRLKHLRDRFQVFYNGGLIGEVVSTDSIYRIFQIESIFNGGADRGYVDYFRVYDKNDVLQYSEEFEDSKQSASNYPLAFSCKAPWQQSFTDYFNQRTGTHYSFAQIDSIYTSTGTNLRVYKTYDSAAVQCSDLDSLIKEYKRTYLQPATGYADLDMRTFAGNITPAEGPKGVFDVNGLLIGNTTDGTADQINASFVQVWNSSSVNQQVGALSLTSGGKFRLQLNTGQMIPKNGIVGMRYYQFDTPYDTLDAVITNLGSYVDFGDGQRIRVDSNYISSSTTTTLYYYGYITYFDPFYAVAHAYSSGQIRTVTVYHTDINGALGFDNWWQGSTLYLPKLKNLRGYAPQNCVTLVFHSTQDSTFNTFNGLVNKDKIAGLKFVQIASFDPQNLLDNYNFGSLQQFHDLEYFRYEGLGPKCPGVNFILPNIPVNFPNLKEFEANLPQYSDSINFSLPNLRWLVSGGLSSSAFVDRIINQVAFGSTVDSGILSLTTNSPRTSASDSAVAILATNRHWLVATATELLNPNTIPRVDTTMNLTSLYPASSQFVDFINSKLGSSMNWYQVNNLYLQKCGALPDYSTPDSSGAASPDTVSCKQLSFIRTFGSTGGDSVMDLVQTPDGGYLTAGVTHSVMGGADAFVAKTDKTGIVQWYKSYGGTRTESFARIRNTSDGGFIALGNTNSFSQITGEPLLVKGSANGEVQWSRTLGAGSRYGENAIDVVQTSDGGYAIAANYNNTPDSVKWEVLRLGSMGNILWAKKMGGTGANNCGGLLEDRDTLVLSGLTVGKEIPDGSSDAQYDGVLMKIDKNDGSIIWSKSYNIDSLCNWFFDIHNTPNGYLINGVETTDFAGPDYGGQIQQMAVEVDKTGHTSRMRRIPPPAPFDAGSIALYPTPDGGYISTQGERDSTADVADVYIQKTNNIGSIAWSNRILLPRGQHIGRVLQNSEGSYTGAGYSDGKSLLIRFDSLGKTGCSDSAWSSSNDTVFYHEKTVNIARTVTDITSAIIDPQRTLTVTNVPFTQTTQCYNAPCPRIISDTLFLCGRAQPVFTPVSLNTITNCSDSSFFAVSKSTVLFSNYTDSLQGNFDSTYRAKCMQAYKYESFTVTHVQSEFHHTLYYYDQAGNLLKTVPPAGVQANYDSLWLDGVAAARAADQSLVPAHGLNTQYRYNTLNQVIAQQTPDAGQSRFWYDRLGRLAISQNARQKYNSTTETNRQYSYTLYDYIGRITEVGQIANATGNPMTDSISRNETYLTSWITGSAANKEQITQTVYDLAYPGFPGVSFTPIGQRNLRNRVSYTSFTLGSNPAQYNQGTFYTYDIEGNVDTLLQDYGSSTIGLPNIMNMNGNRFKRMVYQYDLVSGKVNSVAYQPHQKDAFYHRYTYDAENRLILAETSQDSVYWDKEARYEYYKHGPLARVVIGDKMVQGLDYAYTLQGWLKGVNSNSLLPAYDMGRDGDTSNQNRYIGRDAYGFSLNYYAGDYSAIGTGIMPFPGSGAFQNNAYRPLFNGNISSMGVNIGQLYRGDSSHWRKPMVYSYRYDQLNRITGMDAFYGLDQAGNTYQSSLFATADFKERIAYDANGNIQKYLRNNFGETGLPMDSLGYNYLAGTNKLAQIHDSAADFVGGNYDLHNQPAGNYAYDSIGNLVKDSIEHINGIKWNVYGKITEIDHATTTAAKPIKNIYYYYDAAGNRIGKKTTRGDSTAASYTWYVRDASGNVMATYTASADTGHALSTADLHIGEKHIYGSSRLGIVTADYSTDADFDGLNTYVSPWTGVNVPYYTGKKQYELTNHLGNVLATISDKKIGISLSSDSSLIDHYEADVQTAQDYYPFGMVMPGRMFTALTVPGGSVSGTTQVNGFTVPVDLALSSRTGNEPTQYVASRSIDLDEGFESGVNDDVTAYLTDTSYAGGGNGGNGADGVAGAGKYRYGFNGKENDNEVKGMGDQIDYGFRVYDPRIGRFLSVDPLIKEYPQLTPFQFASNSPISGVDRDGREIAGFGHLVDLLAEGASKLGLQRTAGFISTYGHSVNIDPIDKAKDIFSAAKTGSVFKVVQQIDPTGVTSLPETYQTAKAAWNGDAYAQGQLLGMAPGLYGGFKAITAGKAGGTITEEPTGTQATAAHGTTEAAPTTDVPINNTPTDVQTGNSQAPTSFTAKWIEEGKVSSNLAKRYNKLNKKQRPYQDFTKAGKAVVRDINKEVNGGHMICVYCNVVTPSAEQSKVGVTPSLDESNVDHSMRRREGGSGTPDNGDNSCRNCNVNIKH